MIISLLFDLLLLTFEYVKQRQAVFLISSLFHFRLAKSLLFKGILRQEICGSFFLALKSSTFLSENIAVFHSNDDLFNQYHFLNEKGVIWWLLHDDLRAREREQEEKGTTNSAPNSHVPDNKPHSTSGQYPLMKYLGLNQFFKSRKQGLIAYCPNTNTVPSIAFRSSSSTSSGFIRDCKAHRIWSSVSFLFCWFICKYYWLFKEDLRF